MKRVGELRAENERMRGVAEDLQSDKAALAYVNSQLRARVAALEEAAEWAAEFVECLYTEKKILRGPWCRSGMECVEKLRAACPPPETGECETKEKGESDASA